MSDKLPGNLVDTRPVEELTYEQALNELESIVAGLEAEEVPLDAAMALFERGQLLVQHCSALLEKADLRVRQILGSELVDFDG